MKIVVLCIVLVVVAGGCLGLFGPRVPDTPPQEPPPVRTPAQATFEYGMAGVGVLAVMLLGVSLGALAAGMGKIAFTGIVAAIATGGSSTMMLYYSKHLAWVLCALAVAAIILLAIWVIKTRRRIYGQIVKTCELAKGSMTKESHDELFGGKNAIGLANVLQSPDTKRIVAECRVRANDKTKKGGD